MGNKGPRFPHVEKFGPCSTAPANANAYIEELFAAKGLTKKCSSQPFHREKALVPNQIQPSNYLPPK